VSKGKKKTYKGITALCKPTPDQRYSMHLSVPHTAGLDPTAAGIKSYRTVVLFFADAEAGAKTHDCVHILLHGTFAATNFPFTAYTPACVQAAAEKLRHAGCDLRVVIAAAQRAPGPCTWRRICPAAAPGEWEVSTTWNIPGKGKPKPGVMKLVLGPFPNPLAAARAADAAMLVLDGPLENRNPPLNFPVASYTNAEIEAARNALVAWVAGEQFSGAHNHHADRLLQGFAKNISFTYDVRHSHGCTGPR
jgi:hypothetical protein